MYKKYGLPLERSTSTSWIDFRLAPVRATESNNTLTRCLHETETHAEPFPDSKFDSTLSCWSRGTSVY